MSFDFFLPSTIYIFRKPGFNIIIYNNTRNTLQLIYKIQPTVTPITIIGIAIASAISAPGQIPGF